jgi:DNA-binding NarL/FixJ family response regulator
MKRVIIVDDHELFRLGVKGAIENKHPDISIVGEADSGVAFFRLLDKVAADIVLLDIFLPDTSGIEIARRLKKERPGMRILAISSENSAEVVKTLISIGYGFGR